MTSKTLGAPLKYKDLEQINTDTELIKGEYYIFKKDTEIISLRTAEQVENATNPVKVKDNFLTKLREQTGETPRIVYVSVSWGEIKEWTHPYYGTGYYIIDYRVEFHMQDTGVITASVVLAIAALVLVTGIVLVAAWLVWRVIGAAEETFGGGGVVGIGIIILVGIFILVFVIIGGKGKITTKKGTAKLG